MSSLLPPPTVTARQRRLALAVAGTADFLQIILFPFFFEGIASPFDNVVDILVALLLTAVLGFKWRVVLGFVLELVPGLALFPTWTLLILALPVQAHTPMTVQNLTRVPPQLTPPAPPLAPPPPPDPDIIDAETLPPPARKP